MPRRIEMGAVMSRQRDMLYRPAFAIGQILLAQSRKEFHHVGGGFPKVRTLKAGQSVTQSFGRAVWGPLHHLSTVGQKSVRFIPDGLIGDPDIGGDIRDVYSEAKGGGFDVKTMRKVISLRKMDAADRDEQEAILDVYKQALGMV